MSPLTDTPKIDVALEQRLCQACGFCCDGTLFVNVRIREAEPIDTYKKAGLRISDSTDGLTIMTQPCSEFRDQCCQTYHCRPLRCGEFRCRLLMRVAEEDMDESQALNVIEITRQLRTEYSEVLLTIFPAFKTKALASTFREIRKASRRLTGEALKTFRSKKKKIMALKIQVQHSLDEHFYTNDTKT